MIAIFPVFFEYGQELWRTEEGKGLIRKSFQSAFDAGGIKKVIVFTNDNSILNLAKSLDIDSYMIDIDTETQQSELLPSGSYPSVTHLQKNLNIDFDNLMIFSFKNPMLTSDLVDEAVTKFRKSRNNALISIKKSIDHPCQLNAYYRISDIGFIHMFDDDNITNYYVKILYDLLSIKQHTKKLCYRVTKPFYFDWEAKGVQEKCEPGMYRRRCDNMTTEYIPFNDVHQEVSYPLWIYEGNKKARIIFRLNNHEIPNRVDKGLYLAGAAYSDDFNHISCVIFNNFKENEYLLSFDLENLLSNSSILRAFPIEISGAQEKGIIEIAVDDFSKPISLKFEEKDTCGIVYSLLKVAEDDTYDLCEPFPPDETLWTGSIQKINVKTGKEILGRYDFPDVFEPDGTFFIVKKDIISSFDREISEGNADGFIMKESDSIQIKTKLDLLRYRAVLKTINKHSGSRNHVLTMIKMRGGGLT